MLRLVLLLPCLLFMAACASLPDTETCVRLGAQAHACLLPPSQLPPTKAVHVVDVHSERGDDTFIGRLQVNEAAVRLAGSSLMGVDLFTVAYDGRHIRASATLDDLEPRMMLLVLQLALAEPADMAAQLHGVQLDETRHEDGIERTLSRHGKTLLMIQRSAHELARARMDITLPEQSVRLQFTPLEDDS